MPSQPVVTEVAALAGRLRNQHSTPRILRVANSSSDKEAEDKAGAAVYGAWVPRGIKGEVDMLILSEV
jgi:hypothetical protein